MNITTQFTESLAVEAWDAWYRRRDYGELRDLTIDSTWNRVADAVAAVEGQAAATWSARFADAFAGWQLLPDERLLREAGTGVPLQWDAPPVAILNAAAFVRTAKGLPRLERDQLRSTASLAVRLLDNALLAAGTGPGSLRIGLIGVADALSRLGLRYDSEPALRQARTIAATLAEGCLQGTVALAAERGPHAVNGNGALVRLWRSRGMASDLIADALRRGVRHARLTAITPQPRLALFANRVSDALDPQLPVGLLEQSIARRGCVAWRRGALPTLRPDGTVSDVGPVPRMQMRAAVQPWIDAPIDSPFIVLEMPDPATLVHCAELARRHNLSTPLWQPSDERAPLSEPS